MSFYDIKDPEVRNATIEDYLALKKRIKERNLEERTNYMVRQHELGETFKPIVASNEKMARDIVKDLTPITEELKEMSNNMRKEVTPRPIIGSKRKLVSDNGPLTDAFLHRYMTGDADTTFGIRYDNEKFMIGDKIVKFQGDNIVIDGEVYNGTPGLWMLLTDKNPKDDYDEIDYERYKELLHETHVLHRDFDPVSNYPRANKSRKWNRILSPIWYQFQVEGIVPDDDYFSPNEFGNGVMYLQKGGRCFNINHQGHGIHFTPRPTLAGIRGDGLYLRVGSSVYDGHGLLLGPRSPFKNVPILKWIL